MLSKSWKSLCAIFLVTMFLSGCAATSFDCLPVPAYTPAQQEKAAEELAKLPEDSVVARMVADYMKVRDMSRICAPGGRRTGELGPIRPR